MNNNDAIAWLLKSAETRCSVGNRWPTQESILMEVMQMVRKYQEANREEQPKQGVIAPQSVATIREKP